MKTFATQDAGIIPIADYYIENLELRPSQLRHLAVHASGGRSDLLRALYKCMYCFW